MRWCLVPIVLALPLAASALAQSPPVRTGLEIKYVRDGEEYATLTRQVYRVAGQRVAAAQGALPRGRAWAVVLDVAQTALDDAGYQLERLAYGVPHDTNAYGAWRAREGADAVPGVVEFVTAVRRLGGRVAWITNDQASARDHVRGNLGRVGAWADTDVLCVPGPDTAYTKAARRAEVAAGTGRCSFGQPATVLVFVGDQLGDFPRAGESDPDAGNDAAFGTRYFLLPNPMYGAWERRVTRRR